MVLKNDTWQSRDDTNIIGDGECFRKKYYLDTPYILYDRSKDAGKNVHILLEYSALYKREHAVDLKLVLIGGGSFTVVLMQDKYNACNGALLLCQPSKMESCLCARLVLVNAACDVTKNFVLESNGGLYFNGYSEFAGCVNYIIKHPLEAKVMGENGKDYIRENFSLA